MATLKSLITLFTNITVVSNKTSVGIHKYTNVLYKKLKQIVT